MTAVKPVLVSFVCFVMAFSARASESSAEIKVILCPQTQLSQPLTERCEWASVQAKAFGHGYWVGYSIERQMDTDERLGSIYTSHGERKPSLKMIIEGPAGGWIPSDEDAAVEYNHDSDVATTKVIRHVAILLEISEGALSFENVRKVKVSDLDGYVNLNGEPLIWLGMTEQEESYTFLATAYDQMQPNEAKENIIAAIGIHQECPAVVSFLRKIIGGDEDDIYRKRAVFWLAQQDNSGTPAILSDVIMNDRSKEVREEAVFAVSLIKTDDALIVLKTAARTADDRNVREKAVFWLAQKDNPETLAMLSDIIKNDPSEKIRTEAVFGLSRMNTPGATEKLIELARSSGDAAVCKQAIFWLGQKASKESANALSDIVYDAGTIEIKKQAVFALSRLKNNEGVPELIAIAQDHPSSEVRKQAIFWLGQSGDPRAVDTIVDIVHKQ